jgi:hypothetical protein
MTYAIITIAPETCVIYLASTKTLLNLLHITRPRRHSGGGRVISGNFNGLLVQARKFVQYFSRQLFSNTRYGSFLFKLFLTVDG